MFKEYYVMRYFTSRQKYEYFFKKHHDIRETTGYILHYLLE